MWPPNSIITFYIWNISIIGNDQFLRRQFADKGTLVDFFIPLKTNKAGGKFGFVRYKKPNDLLALERKLDDIWLGSYKIRVNRARFGRHDKELSRP